MKMKKLTALALAGVLCLGMSTTAFAAASPGPADAIKATEDGRVVTGSAIDLDEEYDGMFADWDAEDPNDASDAIKDTLDDRLSDLNKYLKKVDEDEIAPAQLRKLQEEQALLEELVNSDAKYEIATLADLDVTVGEDASEENPVNVRFNLNGRLDNLASGQTIRILHYVDGTWQIYETTVQLDDYGYYAEWAFESFSPVAVIRVTDAGAVVDPGEEPGEEPGQEPGQEPAGTPSIDNGANANGTITADQLADLIVKKLQQNADAASKAVVRTAGKASPKTGE